MKRDGGAKRDLYQEITDRMVAKLEAGTAPWLKPWVAGARPRSMSTGKPYQGINVLLTGMTALERGYTSPWWGTFNQIQEMGGNVRKGENQANGRGATTVIFFKEYVKKDAEPVPNPRTGELELPVSRVASAFRVFNAEQTEGLPEKFSQGVKLIEGAAIPEPQAVLDAYLAGKSGPGIAYDVHGKAHYQPGPDMIHMPPMNEHRSPEHFYATSFHEATHSTGHESRLARPGVTELAEKGHGFGSHPYGKEELVAEMGSAMLCAETGIEAERVFDNSAAYLASWLDTIKGDPKMVAQAASQAGKAADLVLEASREAAPAAEPQPALELEAAG